MVKIILSSLFSFKKLKISQCAHSCFLNPIIDNTIWPKSANIASKSSLSTAISKTHKYPEEFKAAKLYQKNVFVIGGNHLKLTCGV